MFIQDALQKLEIVSAGFFQRSAFLVIFLLVVVSPLVTFAMSGRDPKMAGQVGLAWPLLLISLLLLCSIGIGFSMFRREIKAISISSM